MNKVKQLKENYKLLNNNQKTIFIFSYLERTKHLYKIFEDEIKDDKYDYSQRFKNGFNKLTEFTNFLLDNYDDLSSTNVDEFHNQIENLAPKDDQYSSFQSAIAVNIILITINLITLIQKKNEDTTESIDFILDIINNLKSEEFYNDNPDAEDEESEEYLEIFYNKELETDESFIRKLKNNNFSKEDFITYNSTHIII